MGVYPIDSNEEITIDAQAKAMFTNRRAKNDFKERIAIFCPEEYKREIVFNRTLTEFQYALSNGRITYYLQPQVDMETGEIIGAEALTRWIDKDGSLISPATFIPALEESGFVVTLDKYVWQGVAMWLRERLNRGLRVVPISLNVSMSPSIWGRSPPSTTCRPNSCTSRSPRPPIPESPRPWIS